jgi:hypothetical protein
MNNNIVNSAPYLRTSSEFPFNNAQELAVQLTKTYLDIANVVNNRTIGIFPTTQSAITGNSYFISKNRKQQSLRQVYTFTSSASINHGINTSAISGFIDGYGSFTDGTNFYGLPFMTNTAIAGQISFYITPTQIVFSVGGGAPTITSGQIVIEWLSLP